MRRNVGNMSGKPDRGFIKLVYRIGISFHFFLFFGSSVLTSAEGLRSWLDCTFFGCGIFFFVMGSRLVLCFPCFGVLSLLRICYGICVGVFMGVFMG